MVIGTIVVLLVIGGLVASAAAARVQGEDQRSVARHHEAMTRLGSVVARGGRAPGLSPLVAPSRSAGVTPAPRSARRSRRPRRALAALIGLVVVIGCAALVAEGVETAGSGVDVSTSGTATIAPSTTAPSATAPSTTGPATTASAAPSAPERIVPRSADERSAQFATGRSVSLLLVATRGRCWVGVRGAGDGGEFQVTLEAGDQRRIDGVAPLEVRLGNPGAVDVLVGAVRADVPAPEGHPFDLTFTDA